MTHHGHQIKINKVHDVDVGTRTHAWAVSEEMVSRMSLPKSYFPDSCQDLDEAVISLPNYQAINLRRKHHFVLT